MLNERMAEYYDLINNGEVEQAYHKLNSLSKSTNEIIYLKSKITRLLGNYILSRKNIEQLTETSEYEQSDLYLHILIEKTYTLNRNQKQSHIEFVNTEIKGSTSPLLLAEYYSAHGNVYLSDHDDKAIQYLEKALKYWQELEFQFFIGYCHLDLAFIKTIFMNKSDCFEHVNVAMSISKSLNDRILLRRCYDLLALYYLQFEDPNQSIQYFDQSYKLRKEIQDDKIMFNNENYPLLNQNKALALKRIGNFSGAISLLKEIIENRNNHHVMRTLGRTYAFIGEYTESLKWLEKSKELCKETNNDWALVDSYLYLAEVHAKKGDAKEGRDLLDKAFNIIENWEEYTSVKIFVNLIAARIFFYYLEFERSLEYIQKCKKLNEKVITIDRFDIEVKILEGKVYYQLGHFSKALDIMNNTFKLSLNEYNKLKGVDLHRYCISILSTMVSIYIEINELKKAKDTIAELQRMHNQFETRFGEVYLNYMTAAIKLSSKRGKELFEAKETLENIISSDIVDFNITISSILMSIEILFGEQKLFPENIEIIGEIERHTERLREYASKNEIISLNIIYKIISSYVFTISGEYEKATTLQLDAMKIASEFDLEGLITQTDNQNQVISQHKLEQYLMDKPSSKEALEKLNIELYIQKARKYVKQSTDTQNQ